MQLGAARTQPGDFAPEAAWMLQEALPPAAGQTLRGDWAPEVARTPLVGLAPAVA